MSRALVTGVAGFIGHHVAAALLDRGVEVVGVDALTEYGGRELKDRRRALLAARPGFTFLPLDLARAEDARAAVAQAPGAPVVHLAAQPGVRYSIENPAAYVQSNVVGFVNLLEAVRAEGTPHFVYASSSSVYGANSRMPYATGDQVDHPISLYAATKKADELIAHSYAHIHRLPCTGLRFFTVYGPWGRTDMAPYLFTRALLEGTPLTLYNHGRSRRDFTYVDDVVEAVLAVLALPPEGRSGPVPDGETAAPYRLLNVGASEPVALRRFVEILEGLTGRKAKLELKDAQPGDVEATFADVAPLETLTGRRPAIGIEEGLARYVAWFRPFYGL